MIRYENNKPERYIPDLYVKIHFSKEAYVLSLEGTQDACNKALCANPELRACIQHIEFLDRKGWKKAV